MDSVKPTRALAREWAKRFFDALEKYPVTLDEIAPVLLEAEGFASDAALALVEAMDSEDEYEAVAAAWGVLLVGDANASVVGPSCATRAEAMLRACLESEPDEMKRVACFLLRLGGARRSFLEPLKLLLTPKNTELDLLVAGVITRIDANCISARNALRAAVNLDNDGLSGLAISDLLRLDCGKEETLQLVRNRFARLSEVGQYVILLTIGSLAPRAQALCDLVAATISNDYAHLKVRKTAAIVLGGMGCNKDRVAMLLFKALDSRHRPVVEGAIEGLQRNGQLPQDGAWRLIRFLEDKDESVRLWAAQSLQSVAIHGEYDLPRIISRLREEQNIDVCWAMTQAIAATGVMAIPALLAVIHWRDARTTEPAMRSLARLGERGAETLARLCVELPEEADRKLVVMVLASMGEAARPAIPFLATTLNETRDDELAMYVVMGMYACGPSTASAIDALIRCIVSDRPQHVREWAERALGANGGQALPALRSAVASKSGEGKRRLEEALAKLNVADYERFKRFEVLDDDVTLDLFVHVADLIAERGALSFQRLSDVFERERDERAGIGFPTSARGLLLGVQKLERHFGCTLMERRPGRKGGVTSEGIHLLEEVKEYLSVKRDRLGLSKLG